MHPLSPPLTPPRPASPLLFYNYRVFFFVFFSVVICTFLFFYTIFLEDVHSKHYLTK
uniref:Uncharacterized protein n=1 Tax=Anguilla anguilla TaxID=7936 RepID=A0A0E9TPG4_ANGAN